MLQMSHVVAYHINVSCIFVTFLSYFVGFEIVTGVNILLCCYNMTVLSKGGH